MWWSRAWRRTVTWLREVTANRTKYLTMSASWKLLYYDHRLEVGEQQLDGRSIVAVGPCEDVRDLLLLQVPQRLFGSVIGGIVQENHMGFAPAGLFGVQNFDEVGEEDLDHLGVAVGLNKAEVDFAPGVEPADH